ncbi:MAG: hypothetical protein EOO02_21090 [Chitinophagaceae bacterium]|nr:MAG: hypothetical protein EOO02_21090 [Chitinophagaceae bacterium]
MLRTGIFKVELNSKDSFLPSMMPFVKKIIGYANIYTMVQVIIKCAAPGIPDIYRGCELWDLSYVDPDNRRYVNYDLRKRLLHELKEHDKTSRDAVLQWAEKNYQIGAQKFFVTREILRFRRANAELFSEGEYIPVYGKGSERNVISFIRKYGNKQVLVILPLGVVEDTGKDLQLQLPAGSATEWINIFTKEEVSGDINVHELYKKFPVAVLSSKIDN